jgi:hypothetical protein
MHRYYGNRDIADQNPPRPFCFVIQANLPLNMHTDLYWFRLVVPGVNGTAKLKVAHPYRVHIRSPRDAQDELTITDMHTLLQRDPNFLRWNLAF